MYLLMVSSSAILFTLGGICMKLSQGLSQPLPSLLVYVFFIAGASLQTLAMRKGSLGVTSVVVLSLESVLAFVFGVLLFHETYSFTNIAGVSFIVAGTSFLHGDSDDSKTYATIPSTSCARNKGGLLKAKILIPLRMRKL